MVSYLGVSDIQRLVSRIGPATFIERLAGEIEADYARWEDFEKSARLASHSPVGVIELMPTSDSRLYSFKYVNGHPQNTAAGLLTVTAFGVLADVATGAPTLVSELTLTTAMRTAATSVMAARALARPGSRTMALIGNGAQSEFQALAFHHLLGINEIRAYDTDPAATTKLMRHLSGIPGLRVVPCDSTAEALRGADIVTTVTADKRNAVIVDAHMLEPGMHLNAVGGDCPGKTELHADVLRASKVFVEYEAQTRVEGDLQQMPADFCVTELWRVLCGQAAGRRSAEEITLFDSVGFALEDFSALKLVAQMARDLSLGQAVALIPELRDPKDLFGALGHSALQLRAA